mmetsp:Transcript_30089/g.77620  ORF Transcript_30089/g.77620 Transcript_30089/m.77620 type:complete len:232 (+) Transcript_30089:1966-2661(+)
MDPTNVASAELHSLFDNAVHNIRSMPLFSSSLSLTAVKGEEEEGEEREECAGKEGGRGPEMGGERKGKWREGVYNNLEKLTTSKKYNAIPISTKPTANCSDAATSSVVPPHPPPSSLISAISMAPCMMLASPNPASIRPMTLPRIIHSRRWMNTRERREGGGFGGVVVRGGGEGEEEEVDGDGCDTLKTTPPSDSVRAMIPRFHSILLTFASPVFSAFFLCPSPPPHLAFE